MTNSAPTTIRGFSAERVLKLPRIRSLDELLWWFKNAQPGEWCCFGIVNSRVLDTRPSARLRKIVEASEAGDVTSCQKLVWADPRNGRISARQRAADDIPVYAWLAKKLGR